jgi:hypothetical protein
MGVQEKDGDDDDRHDAITDVPTETPLPPLRNRAGNRFGSRTGICPQIWELVSMSYERHLCAMFEGDRHVYVRT